MLMRLRAATAFTAMVIVAYFGSQMCKSTKDLNIDNSVQWSRLALTSQELSALRLVFKADARSARNPPNNDLRHLIEKMDFFEILKAVRPRVRIVRIVLFNKNLAHNWALPWHQDRVIHVKNRQKMAGFTNWTKKSEQWHCEAPEQILHKMSFMQIYLDDVKVDEGPMEIALGSHKHGAVRETKIAAIVTRHKHDLCCAEAGDILRVPMLTIHRSHAAQKLSKRRLIRLDLAEDNLPQPLMWGL